MQKISNRGTSLVRTYIFVVFEFLIHTFHACQEILIVGNDVERVITHKTQHLYRVLLATLKQVGIHGRKKAQWLHYSKSTTGYGQESPHPSMIEEYGILPLTISIQDRSSCLILVSSFIIVYLMIIVLIYLLRKRKPFCNCLQTISNPHYMLFYMLFLLSYYAHFELCLNNRE